MLRLPADFSGFLDGLGSKFGGRDVEEHISTRGFQFDHLAVDRGISDLIGQLLDDHGLGFVAQSVKESLEVVLTVVVILIKDGDLCIGLGLKQMLSVDQRLALVVRLPSHGPGEVLRIAPLGRASGHEELRHLLLVHVLVDRRVRRRSQHTDGGQNFFFFGQLAGHLERAGRVVAVIERDELDHTAVDAAFGVDLLEIGIHRLADRTIGGCGTRVRVDIPDLDFFVGRASVVLLLRETCLRNQQSTSSGRSRFQKIAFHEYLLHALKKRALRQTQSPVNAAALQD